MNTLNDQAITAALKSNWPAALEINKQILSQDPQDTASLNRMGFCYLNLGKTKEAKKIFEQILKLDPTNTIAQKNLKRAKTKSKIQTTNHNISPLIFLEEPGVTKTTNLINITQKTVVTNLHCGEEVNIFTKKNRVELRNKDNLYIGALPDDLSFRIRKLMSLGNIYQVYIKNITENCLTVIIREVKRGKKVKDPSFSSKSQADYHASIRSEILEGLLEEEVDEDPQSASRESRDSVSEEE